MIKYLTCTSELKAIADAIRSRGKTSSSLVYPDGFVTAISNISTEPVFGSSTVTPLEEAQTITPDSQYDAFSAVYVNAISSDYVGTAIPRISAADIVINGSKATVPYGYYLSSIQASITKGSAYIPATTITVNPLISIDANGLVTAEFPTSYATITPFVTSGYISSGTSGLLTVAGTNSLELSFQHSVSITPGSINQVAVSSGVFMDGTVTVSPIPSDYIGSGITIVQSSTYYGSTVSYYFPAGTYFAGDQILAGDSNLLPENIRKGITIFSTVGTYEDSSASYIDENVIVQTRSFPQSYENQRITRVGSYVFVSNSYIVSINFPLCVEVSRNAFASASRLYSVNLPLCTSLGDYAFYSCSSLSTINIPQMSYIPSNCFYGTSLKNVSLSMCKIIYYHAFDYCRSISAVSLPLCESIDSYAFYRCSSISSFYAPLCEYIGESAFNSCAKLSFVDFPVCKTIGSAAFSTTGLTSATFEECISIGANAFLNTSSLSTISIPKCKTIDNYAFQNTGISSMDLSKCEYIGYGAFTSCQNLIYFKASNCTSIDYYAFRSCYNLVSVSFQECVYLRGAVFASCSSLESAVFPKCTGILPSCFMYCRDLSFVSFDACINILSSAFYACSSLTSCYFPLCDTIESNVFNGCINLSSVYFPLCRFVGSSAFYRCTNLTEIDLPNCSTVNPSAFYSCDNLQTIRFSVVSTLTAYAFYNCYNLKSVYILTSSVPRIVNNTFPAPSLISNAKFYVFSSMLDSFLSNGSWNTYSSLFVTI